MAATGCVHGPQVFAFEPHFAAARIFQTENEFRGRCFTATGFADHAQCFTGFDGKGNTIDRADHAAGAAEHAPARDEVFGDIQSFENDHGLASPAA